MKPNHRKPIAELSVVSRHLPMGAQADQRSFQRALRWLSDVWIKLNIEWAKAGEMQRRIDDMKAEHRAKYECGRWHL
jgi:hypothetical protein